MKKNNYHEHVIFANLQVGLVKRRRFRETCNKLKKTQINPTDNIGLFTTHDHKKRITNYYRSVDKLVENTKLSFTFFVKTF